MVVTKFILSLFKSFNFPDIFISEMRQYMTQAHFETCWFEHKKYLLCRLKPEQINIVETIISTYIMFLKEQKDNF